MVAGICSGSFAHLGVDSPDRDVICVFLPNKEERSRPGGSGRSNVTFLQILGNERPEHFLLIIVQGIGFPRIRFCIGLRSMA